MSWQELIRVSYEMVAAKAPKKKSGKKQQPSKSGTRKEDEEELSAG